MGRTLQNLLPRTTLRVGVMVCPGSWSMYGPVDDPRFRFELKPFLETEDPRVFVDARDIREWFQSIRTPDDALDFFKKTNLTGLDRFSEIRLLQRFIHDASVCPVWEWPKLEATYPERWVECLIEPPLISLIWENKQPVLQCDVSNWQHWFQHVIGSLLQLEALMGIEQRACDRLDCHWTFDPGRGDKRYHSRNCANVARNREKRMAKAKRWRVKLNNAEFFAVSPLEKHACMLSR